MPIPLSHAIKILYTYAYEETDVYTRSLVQTDGIFLATGVLARTSAYGAYFYFSPLSMTMGGTSRLETDLWIRNGWLPTAAASLSWRSCEGLRDERPDPWGSKRTTVSMGSGMLVFHLYHLCCCHRTFSSLFLSSYFARDTSLRNAVAVK